MKVKATTKVKAARKLKAMPARKVKATTKVKRKAAMELKTQGTEHLTFLNMFLKGEDANNLARFTFYICGNLVTTDGRSYTVFKI